MENINKRIDSIIDWLTEPDGGNAVTESDIREAIVELKELRKLKLFAIPVVSEAKRKLPMAIAVHRAAKLMSYENFASWYNERFGNSR